MTEKKSYPEEIYKDAETGGEHFIPRFRETFEKAYDLGYEHGQKTQEDPLASWSNLAEAIKDKARIDWDALDGLPAKCVHPELGTLTYKMERDDNSPSDSYVGWYKEDCPYTWGDAFYESWYGRHGWSLWVKGDLPLRKLTADQLAPGTGFCGAHPESGEKLKGMVVVPSPGARKAVIFTRPVPYVAATDVEVIEAYGVGTYYKPEGDA